MPDEKDLVRRFFFLTAAVGHRPPLHSVLVADSATKLGRSRKAKETSYRVEPVPTSVGRNDFS